MSGTSASSGAWGSTPLVSASLVRIAVVVGSPETGVGRLKEHLGLYLNRTVAAMDASDRWRRLGGSKAAGTCGAVVCSPIRNGRLNPAWHATVVAAFVVALGDTVVVTLLRAIIADLAGFGRQPWASTSYLVGAATVMPIAARLAGIHGRTAFFLIGLTVESQII